LALNKFNDQSLAAPDLGKNTDFWVLLTAFEKRAMRVPVSRVIGEDLHSLHGVSIPAGQIACRAP
jgi:hypothetical protein